MKRPYPHKRRERILPSFPNNRLSSRPGKKKARKQTFVEDEFTTYNQVPESAVSTPWDMPNPTDNAPLFSDYWLREENGYVMQEFPGGELMHPGAGGFANSPWPEQFLAENQSNPFMQENIPPKIESVEILTWDDWGTTWGVVPVVKASWSKIDVWVTDVAPFDITIGVVDRDRYVEFSGTGGIYKEPFTTTIEIDYFKDSLDAYDVNVTVIDESGNIAYMQTEVAGFFGGIVDFFEDIWAGLVGVFSAVGAAWLKPSLFEF